jgi:hypothetical protein
MVRIYLKNKIYIVILAGMNSITSKTYIGFEDGKLIPSNEINDDILLKNKNKLEMNEKQSSRRKKLVYTNSNQIDRLVNIKERLRNKLANKNK